MRYKVIGFAVWQGGKWYLRRRVRNSSRKLAIAGLTTAVGVGVLVAQRQIRGD